MGRRRVIDNARSFSIRADKDQIAAIQEYALKTGQTTGDVIRQALTRFVALKRFTKVLERD